MSDLIKRSDAIDVINEAFDIGDCCCDRYGIIGAIQSISTADRPQGEWIVNISEYKSVCSVCGTSEADFIYGTEMWYGLGESKFCPNCGAHMKGADDE